MFEVKIMTLYRHNNEKGMALVICLLIMVVAAMIGIGVATDSTTSGRIALNQRLMARDFYIADGTNQIEVPKIATDSSLGVSNISSGSTLKNDVEETISDITDDPPKYLARIRYHFYRPTKKAGFSFNLFNSYYFSTRTRSIRAGVNKASVNTVQSKIGPKI